LRVDTPYANQIRSAFDFSQKQVRALIEIHPDYFPMYTVNGKWKHDGEKWTHWCDGFLGGQMWIFHQHSQDEYWLKNAIRYSKQLEFRQHDRDVHDLGFIFNSTYLRWLQAVRTPGVSTEAYGNGDPRAAAKHLDDVLIQAGTTLSLRFKENGQYLRSFVEDASLFVDIMMNVGIIFYAAQQQRLRGNAAESRELLRIASAHCKTSARYLIRGDGSTSHEALFNLETGECLKQTTHQGFRADSCWSRGLAWALYGFCTAYQFTGNSAFLDASEMCARYYLQHTPHLIPPWDYDALPIESRNTEDSSAAAIAASGFFNLSVCSPSFEKRTLYRQYFRQMMFALTTEKYLGTQPGYEGILRHGVYHIHKKLGVDESVMWGDYFFVESLSKALSEIE